MIGRSRLPWSYHATTAFIGSKLDQAVRIDRAWKSRRTSAPCEFGELRALIANPSVSLPAIAA